MISFTNARSRVNFEFNTLGEFKSWASDERDFFSGLGPHSYPTIQNNLNIVNRVLSLSEVAEGGISGLDEILDQLASRYVPAEKYLKPLGNSISDGNVRAMFCSEMITSGSIGRPPNFSPQSEAILLAKVFSKYGTLDSINEDVGLAQRHIADIQRENDANSTNWRAFYARCQQEWAEYHIQVALQAPKAYWSKKAEAHERKIGGARNLWLWSVTGNLVIVLFGVLISIFFPPKSNDIPFDMIQRFVFFGSFLGFGIWLSRQQLRNYRSSEHLAEDARERVTMIETYAALKGQGLGGENLETILAALFRPAVTGLVEDNGPSLPIEILFKSLGEAAVKRG